MACWQQAMLKVVDRGRIGRQQRRPGLPTTSGLGAGESVWGGEDFEGEAGCFGRDDVVVGDGEAVFFAEAQREALCSVGAFARHYSRNFFAVLPIWDEEARNI